MTSHLSLSTMQLSILVEQEDQKESKPLSSKINMLCWNSLSFTFLYFPSLSFTLLHSLRFSSLSFTLLHSPSLFFSLLHSPSLSFTFLRSPSLFSSLSFALLHSPSLFFASFTLLHSSSLSFTLLLKSLDQWLRKHNSKHDLPPTLRVRGKWSSNHLEISVEVGPTKVETKFCMYCV